MWQSWTPEDSKDSINYTITIVIVPLERKPDASQSTLIASSHTQVGQHDLAYLAYTEQEFL